MTREEKAIRRQGVIEDYLNGMTRDDLKKKYNVSGISSLVRGYKRVRQPLTKKITPDVKTKILALHNMGKNRYEISEIVKIDFRYVGQKLREWGMKPHKKKYERKVTLKFTFNKVITFIPRELTAGEQRIKDNLKKLDEKIKREGGIPNNYGYLEPLITVQPKHRWV